MADPYDYVEPAGVIVPDTAQLRAEIEATWRSAFGADLVVSPETPQGVLITLMTLARDGMVRNNAAVANQINPNLAEGVFFDAIWALTGGERLVATRSTLAGVQLAGVPGAFIPQGAQARAGEDGGIFELTGGVTLDATGSALGTFQSLEFGPIAAAATTLDRIVSGVLGWETVNNPAGAVLGQSSESDEASRLRRRRTLAAQGVALPEAIISALYLTTGVTSVLFRENVTSADVVEEGVTILAHSILAVVDGGLDTDVARALLANKSLGANWSGNLTVPTLDPVSGQTYPVTFRRPIPVPIYVEVTVSQAGAGGDPTETVKAALAAYASGQQDGEAGLVIGQDVSPFELAGAVQVADPPLYVRDVKIGTAPDALGYAPISITIAQRAQLGEGNITVVVV